MLTLKEVKDNELIEQSITNTIPQKCSCGADIKISESLNEVQCTNPKCKFKIISRILNFLKLLFITDWTQSEIEQLVDKYDIVTPFQFMMLNQLGVEELVETVPNIKQKLDNIEQIKSNKYHLWQIVKYASIPYISTIAYELFGNYDSIDKAYEDIEAEQVSFIAEKLGINNNEPSILALFVYNKLIEIKEELQFGETQFNIIKYELNPIKIVIATSINEFVNKYEFMEYLNARYKNEYSFVLESKVTANTSILINENSFDSIKYRSAKRINEEYIKESIENNIFKNSDIGKENTANKLLKIGEKIAIVTGKELIERLDSAHKSNLITEAENSLDKITEDDWLTQEDADLEPTDEEIEEYLEEINEDIEEEDLDDLLNDDISEDDIEDWELG